MALTITTARIRAVLLALLLVLLALGTAAQRNAHAATDKVLILGSTVSGGMTSMEAQAAITRGLGVDIVTDAQWAAMTAAQFAAYRAIILGDPTCGGTPPAVATANAAVWNGTVNGNVIVIGTDPNFHALYSAGSGGAVMIDKGVGYAVDQAGKTGAYVDLSCYYGSSPKNTPVPMLAGIGVFTVESALCFNDAHIVATHPALVGLTDANLSNWSCSVHEVFDSFPADFTVLVIARNFAGGTYTAPDGSKGTPYVVARGGGLVAGNISLGPLSATNNTGTNHTVTATVQAGGTPVVGTTVTFKVISGPNAGLTGTGVTNASGQATFTYTSSVAGTDSLTASFVDASGHTQTSNTVTKTWVAVTPPPPSGPMEATAELHSLILDERGNPAGPDGHFSFHDDGVGTLSVLASSIGMDPTKTYTSYLLDNGANPDTCAPGPMPLNAAQSLVGTWSVGFDGGGSLAVDKTGAGYIALGKFGVVSIVTGGTVVACGAVGPAYT